MEVARRHARRLAERSPARRARSARVLETGLPGLLSECRPSWPAPSCRHRAAPSRRAGSRIPTSAPSTSSWKAPRPSWCCSVGISVTVRWSLGHPRRYDITATTPGRPADRIATADHRASDGSGRPTHHAAVDDTKAPVDRRGRATSLEGGEPVLVPSRQPSLVSLPLFSTTSWRNPSVDCPCEATVRATEQATVGACGGRTARHSCGVLWRRHTVAVCGDQHLRRPQHHGTWRSLAARLLWEQEVAGSNPAVPTPARAWRQDR